MKNIMTIIMGIILLSSVSAIYAGECEEVNLSSFTSSEDIVYLVVGNSSNTDGMEINLTGMIAKVCFAVNYEPDTFTIVFIDNSKRETIVEVHNHYSSGGTRTIYLDNETVKYLDREVVLTETEYVDRVIDLTKEPTPEDTTIGIPPETEEPKKSYLIWYISIAALILIIAYLFYKAVIKDPEEDWVNKKNKELAKENVEDILKEIE